MAQTTAFGKKVKKKLIDIDKNQSWLIDEIGSRTQLYFDDSYLYKILTGQLATPKIVQAIREILDLPDETKEDAS